MISDAKLLGLKLLTNLNRAARLIKSRPRRYKLIEPQYSMNFIPIEKEPIFLKIVSAVLGGGWITLSMSYQASQTA